MIFKKFKLLSFSAILKKACFKMFHLFILGERSFTFQKLRKFAKILTRTRRYFLFLFSYSIPLISSFHSIFLNFENFSISSVLH